ncbi:MAG: type IV secretory system conjugative DNA transfer family protein [Actinomycetota bacterium]|nr:type IV secretory system conjugative DNA transfer family protein [Actinomycetota bacterium]
MAVNTLDLATLRARVAAAGSPLYLGSSAMGPAFAAPQQGMLVLGPPRSGKTTTLVIPNALVAPGPVVSTSTKPDVMAATLAARDQVGQCWLFDPSGRAKPPPGVRPLRWSPVPACRDWEAALMTAKAMTRTARPTAHLGEGAHWIERAEALLAPLLHAAAITHSGMDEVVKWVNRHILEEAHSELEGSGMPWDVIDGLANTDGREMSGIWSTAAGVLAAYRSPAALAMAQEPNFDPQRFPSTTDTVYICSPSHQQALAAPLVVGLIEQIRAGAYEQSAAAISQGRPPPRPVTLLLDEAANIAPIPELPSIVAEGASQGLVTLACFQDLSQARSLWPAKADGFLSLFGVKVILPGIGDVRTLDDLSRLSGERDVPVRSVTRRRVPIGRANTSVTWSTRRQPRLPVDAIAHLPLGTALLIEGRETPTLLRLSPWYCTAPFAPSLERPAPGRQRALPSPGRSL